MNKLMATVVAILFLLLALVFGPNTEKIVYGAGASALETRTIDLCSKILGGAIFISSRPPWLKVGNVSMEIDGFCAEHKLAIEVQGPHHYHANIGGATRAEEYFNYFRSLVKDAFKVKICEARGIRFIRYDYRWGSKVEQIEPYLRSRLYEMKILEVPPNPFLRAKSFSVHRIAALECELCLNDVLDENCALINKKRGQDLLESYSLQQWKARCGSLIKEDEIDGQGKSVRQ